MRLMQFQDGDARFVGAVAGDGRLRRLRGVESVFALAREAADGGAALADVVARAAGEAIEEEPLFAQGKVLSPVDHPEPARMMVSGTGLTHLGSAQSRDQMHADDQEAGTLTDSMRMFRLGLEGGKPSPGEFFGAQPEWFYKGDGGCVVPPGADIARPAFAEGGGEEAEIAGVYIIDRSGMPHRIGFVLGNEFSDHVMEKQNYLWLAHSKLRQCAIGPELLAGDLPRNIQGRSSIRRGGRTIWQKPFLSGEDNMCHSIANLERHHFKYAGFCRPGDIHLHFFGAAALSFSDDVQALDGDEFVIECPVFGRPLVNRLRIAKAVRGRDVGVL
ncbi:MAG: GguC family protein [Gammaproteobacteria bacterium]|nr:GguC family protein [Gammaproteobacteria bacterium]